MNKQLNRVEMIKWLNENTTGDNWKSDQALCDALPVNSGWIAGGCSNLVYLLNQSMTGEVINYSDVFPVYKVNEAKALEIDYSDKANVASWLKSNATEGGWGVSKLPKCFDDNCYWWVINDISVLVDKPYGWRIYREDIFPDRGDGKVSPKQKKMSRDDMIDWLYDNTHISSWYSLGLLTSEVEGNPSCNWQVDVDGDVPQMLNIELGEIIKVLDVFAMRSDYDDGTRPTNSIPEVKTLTPEQIAIIVKQERNHYSREILPGVWVDVYDVLEAFKTDRPCVDHAAKKLLAPGKRGHKDYITDIQNAIDTLQRELQIQERKTIK